MLACFWEQPQERAISGLSSEVEQEHQPTCETCLACGTRLARGAARPCRKTQTLTSCHMLSCFCGQPQGGPNSGRSFEVEQESGPTCETRLTCGTRLAHGASETSATRRAARPCKETQTLTSFHVLARFWEQLQKRGKSWTQLWGGARVCTHLRDPSDLWHPSGLWSRSPL